MKDTSKIAVAFLVALGILLYAAVSRGQDIKFCKNWKTGEIIVVEANMPCPYPTSEI